MRSSLSWTLVVVMTATGCSNAVEDVPTAPLFVAGGKLVTPRARLSYADEVNVGTTASPVWVPAGYRGDGRLRDGTPGTPALSNEYQGDWCGVNAGIGTGIQGQTTQFTFDADQWWSSSLPASCQPARAAHIYLDGPSAAPGITRQTQHFPNLGSMAVGDSLIIPWNNGTGAELGVNLWFDDAYPPASSPRWIRLPNIIDEFGRSVRTWRVETRGSHRAMGAVRICIGKKCSLGPTGTTYYLPFVLNITEVPPPFPTYP